MARKPQVRYFDSRKAFYCQHNGKQHKLADGPDDSPTGPNYLAALTAFRHLLQMGSVEHAKDRNTVRVVLETYLQHKEGKLNKNTLDRRLFVFRPFCAEWGEVAVGDLTHFKVENFILAMRKPRMAGTGGKYKYAWGDASAGLLIDALNAAFNWAIKTKLITANPIAGMDRPPSKSRGRECIITPEQHAMILAECRAATTRNVCIALENTGARPGEITAASAKDWNEQLGAVVYYGDDRRRQDEFRHKAAAHKDRVIYFTGEALEMVKGLVKKHPTGALFRTVRGGGYDEKSVANCFRAIRKRIDMPKLTAYSYRHTRATRWLMSGRSIELLAELLGNTPNTIRKHYAHLCSDRPGVRRHLEGFMLEAESGKPSSPALP